MLFVLAGNLWATQPNLPALKLKGNVKRGRKVFLNAGCATCHVLKDAGVKPGQYVAGPNLDKTKPSYKLVVIRVSLGVVYKGSTEPLMPGFSDLPGAAYGTVKLTSQQIADVAAYVSTVAGN